MSSFCAAGSSACSCSGFAGTVTELVLLEHYEQVLQLVPLVLIVAAVAAIAWQAMRNDAASLRGLEIIMVLFVLAGFAGVAAHFRGSAEFQLDLNPSMSAWELVDKVMRAKAPPLLAPGMMLQMGLLASPMCTRMSATERESSVCSDRSRRRSEGP
jgi:hypothetical protein